MFTAWFPMILTAITYAAFLIFLIGILIRIGRMAAMPIHVRWELHPIPRSTAEKTFYMVSEVLRLEGVRRNNRSLWTWSWLFHVALYLMIGLACLALAASLSARLRDSIYILISILSFTAYVFGTVGTCGLIIMRSASPRLRPTTSSGDFLNLIVLLAIFASGLAHALMQPSVAHIMVAHAGHLIRMNPAPMLHPLAIAHLCLIALFLAYMPYTPMAHMVLKYFTYHSVRWDERTADEMPESLERMKKYLSYPVQWSATHVRGREEKARWADVIVVDGVKEKKVEKD
jgi:nitrate reductase gamma subunit